MSAEFWLAEFSFEFCLVKSIMDNNGTYYLDTLSNCELPATCNTHRETPQWFREGVATDPSNYLNHEVKLPGYYCEVKLPACINPLQQNIDG